jgi:hypothetical protein
LLGRWQELKKIYGDKLGKRDRPRKHRYVFFVGSRKDKKKYLSKLKYDPIGYVSGQSRRY